MLCKMIATVWQLSLHQRQVAPLCPIEAAARPVRPLVHIKRPVIHCGALIWRREGEESKN